VRRALRLLLAAVAVAGILLLFVLPGRTFLAQSHSLAATQKQVSDLSAENAKLKAEAQSLQSNSKIEQIARADYGLVMPGQKAYAVIPAGTTTTTTVPHVQAPATSGSTGATSSSSSTTLHAPSGQ
jgi:cell division protein FtsB